jgi:hypothetical protein
MERDLNPSGNAKIPLEIKTALSVEIEEELLEYLLVMEKQN